MASDGAEAWTIAEPSRGEVLSRMVEAIEKWTIDTSRNINYRSFEPILRLIRVEHTPQCQHWAVWALANLTRVDSKSTEMSTRKSLLFIKSHLIHGCQMAIAKFLDSTTCLALQASGLWLRYAAKFDPFLSMDCPRVEGVGAQSNFAIWQPCSLSLKALSSSDKYCSLIENEGGLTLLEELINSNVVNGASADLADEMAAVGGGPYTRVIELASIVRENVSRWKDRVGEAVDAAHNGDADLALDG